LSPSISAKDLTINNEILNKESPNTPQTDLKYSSFNKIIDKQIKKPMTPG